MMTINNVTIGDEFKKKIAGNKYVDCTVVDLLETKSMLTGKVTETTCVAKSDNYGLGKPFPVSFTTVIKGR